MGSLTRVLADIRIVLVQHEQNPLAGILLADRLQYLADPLFRLVLGEFYETLSVERIESNRRIVGLDQRSFDVWIVDVPDTPRIIVRLGL